MRGISESSVVRVFPGSPTRNCNLSIIEPDRVCRVSQIFTESSVPAPACRLSCRLCNLLPLPPHLSIWSCLCVQEHVRGPSRVNSAKAFLRGGEANISRVSRVTIVFLILLFTQCSLMFPALERANVSFATLASCVL